MQIIYEDENIIVVFKEAGEPTQTAKSSLPDLVSMIKVHLSETEKVKKEPYVGVVHRLDQPVSGLLVFAKDPKSASALCAQLNSRILNKVYTATVEGTDLPNDKGTLTDYMYRDPAVNKSIVVCDAKNKNTAQKIKKAELDYEVLSVDSKKNTADLKITLKTGRFHQIRAQLSNMGHPIVGDVKYGSTAKKSKGILLSAVELEFIHPKTGKKMSFNV